MREARFGIRYLTLQDNSKLPRKCRTLTIPLRTTDNYPGRRLFEPDFLHPCAPAVRRDWTRCVAGRQHLLLCSVLAAEACQDVTHMIQQCKWEAAALWMRRAARLLRGTAGAMTSARIFDTSLYQTFSGGGRRGATQLPDVKLSNEHRSLMKTLRETERTLDSARASKGIAASSEFRDARRAFDEAARPFGGDELFQDDNLDTDSDGRVKPPPFVKDYDLAVGVLRTQVMFIEDYQYDLARSVAIVRSNHHTREVDAETRAQLEDCNKLMLAIVGELLDPPAYQPYA